MLLRTIFLSLFISSVLFAQEKPVVVLELFTSQGCSSCPPADVVLDEIKSSMDAASVIPLSYHVDYWDYIGWKDPYASADYTKKQRFYGRKFKSQSIYTPQLVINGEEHLVGSDRDNIHKKIKQRLHKKEASNSIKINSAAIENDKVKFSYQVNGDLTEKFIHYVLVLNERQTDVKRGENRNRSLKNSNIVVTEEIESVTDKNGNYELKIPDVIKNKEDLNLIVLISDK